MENTELVQEVRGLKKLFSDLFGPKPKALTLSLKNGGRIVVASQDQALKVGDTVSMEGGETLPDVLNLSDGRTIRLQGNTVAEIIDPAEDMTGELSELLALLKGLPGQFEALNAKIDAQNSQIEAIKTGQVSNYKPKQAQANAGKDDQGDDETPKYTPSPIQEFLAAKRNKK